MSERNFRLPAGMVALLMSGTAQAALVISSGATSGVTCSAGACSATATAAVLNVDELASMLASGNVTVQSGSTARDIAVAAPLIWNRHHGLTLDAFRSLTVSAPVVSAGGGNVTLLVSDGGSSGDYAFTGEGRLDLPDPASKLRINNELYRLVASPAELSAAVAARRGGQFALASSYDANADGPYASAVVTAKFTGKFEGLGHTISHLSINSKDENVGLFAVAGQGASLRGLTLSNAVVIGGRNVGALVGYGEFDSDIRYVSVSGIVSANFDAGGVVGYMRGSVSYSTSSAMVSGWIAGGIVGETYGGSSSVYFRDSATGDISGTRDVGGLAGALWWAKATESFATGNVNGWLTAGGLVGSLGYATIERSYATGDVHGTGYSTQAGGLAGQVEQSHVIDTYARGATTSVEKGSVGGLIGFLGSTSEMLTSYALGPSSGATKKRRGGFLGWGGASAYSQNYWDADTAAGAKGFGQCSVADACKQGIVKLRDARLKAALPAGFDPAVWGQNAATNDGYPYLLAVPPRSHDRFNDLL